MRAAAALALVVLLPAAAAAASLEERLPAESRVVGGLDLAKLRSSGLLDVQGLLARSLPGDETGVVAWLRRAGVEPGRDLDRVAFALVPARASKEPRDSKDATAQDADFAVLATGRFERQRLEAQAVAEGGSRLALGPAARPAILLPGQKRGPFAAYLSFPADGVLLVGSERGTQLVPESAGKAAPMLATARSLVPGAAPLWLVADAEGAASAGAGAVSSMKTLALWADTAERALEVRGLGETDSAASATQLAATLQLGAAVAQLKYPPLGGAKVTSEGPKVGFALSLSPAQVQLLLRSSPPPAAAAPPASTKPRSPVPSRQ